MSRRLALIVSIALFVPMRPADDVGFVTAFTGRWRIERAGGSSKAAAVSATLQPGDVLRKLDDEATSHIIVALYSGALDEYAMTTTVAPLPGSSAFGRIYAAIQQRFQEGFVTASVRGGAEFSDAVVQREGSGANLAPVFERVEAGSYQVTARSIDAAGRVRPAPRALTRVEAGPGRRGYVDLPPGLYELAITGSGGNAGSAWVLVVTGRDVEAARTACSPIAPARASDAPELRSAARSVARACLLVLDDEAHGK